MSFGVPKSLSIVFEMVPPGASLRAGPISTVVGFARMNATAVAAFAAGMSVAGAGIFTGIF
jgi:hypothetical protein